MRGGFAPAPLALPQSIFQAKKQDMAKGPKNSSGRGQRDLKVRVKTARGRKLSSTRWLQRQLNDPYVKRARDEGYRGRAAFKIHNPCTWL